MAQLKDLVVNGASRFIGDIFGNKAQLTTLEAPTSAGGSTFGPGTNGQILKSNGSSLYWSDDNGGVTGVKGDAETTYRTGEVNLTAANILGSTAIGTSTTPVYWSGSAFTAGDQYAGGTAVTLNNTSKAKTTASFYAPTAGGANNTQALVGAGTTTAPKWVNISTTLATSTAATASAGQKLKVTVLGQASSEVELTKATNALYGVTKLTDSYSSTDGTMATTGKALLAALQTLDVDAVGVAAATGNKFISQISETDGKISAEVSTATLGSTSLPVWVDGGVIKTITSYEGTAAKATADASGNNIANTYLTKAAGVTDVTVDNSTRKLQKTINGTVSDVTTLVFVPGTGDYSGIGGQTGSDTCTASGKYSLAYGKAAKATAQNAISIGLQTEATGVYSIALGGRNSAIVTPLGTSTTTNTTAAGTAAIAAGLGSVAEGGYSLALGLGSYTKGAYSVAFGQMSYAYSNNSTVIGKANIIDTEEKYALIIGNGTIASGSPYTRNPSNAFTVAWTGNVETAGALLPMTTDTLDIGSSTQKWNDVYAANFKGNADTATAANLETTANAIAIYGDTSGTFVDSNVTIDNNNNIQASSFNGAKIFYGTCATAAGTAQKDVVCANYTNDGDPVKGDIVFVTFNTTNSAAVANLLLKVGNSTAKSLRCLRNGAVNNLPAVDYIRTNETYCFCYNGTAWVTVVDYNSNTNTLMRTYASSANTEVPLVAGSTGTTATAPTHTSSYKDLYGMLPATVANRSTINLSTGAITFNGKLILKSGVTYGDTLPTTNTATGQIFFTPAANSNIAQTEDKIYMVGVKAATDPTLYYNSNVYAENNVLFGAAWNDYAEYRESLELEPGRVVIELGNGRLVRSSERLQPGAEIVSDTYGFIIGKGNPRCATPIAIAGRVLAYPYEERLMFFAGDAVCAGPDGTVSKMTREEIKEYPDRIIGTVSEVPEYETWGENNIKVNGRIWIRLR